MSDLAKLTSRQAEHVLVPGPLWSRLCAHADRLGTQPEILAVKELEASMSRMEKIRPLAACQWCGKENRRGGKDCSGCAASGSRNGSYPCGKPKKNGPVRKDKDKEHVCQNCKPWPRSSGRTPTYAEKVLSDIEWRDEHGYDQGLQ